jgi:creatinine amidohydrolase
MHSFIPPHRFFPYLTWQNIETMPDKDNVVIIQPIGAIEQHGPHLPLIVDSAIATAVTGQALAQLPAEIPAYSLPPLYYGKSNEHINFPGTITLSAQTLTNILLEVGESIYRAGFKKLVFVNGHGGQPQILEIVARDLHAKYPDFCLFPLFVWRVPHIADQLLTERESQQGIHAGDAETSLMLSLLPEQVDMTKAVCTYPPDCSQNLLSIEGALPFAWLTNELSETGVLGDATVATKDKGDRLLASLVASWVEVFTQVHQFQTPRPTAELPD